jgi:hypothetical protein
MTFYFTEETVLSKILKEFCPSIIKYICVASEFDSEYKQPRLNVQIIFNVKKNVTTPFLNKFTCKLLHLNEY